MKSVKLSYIVAMTRPRSPSDTNMKDWRAAVSAPLTYRIGSSTLHFRLHLVMLSCVISVAVLVLLCLTLTGSPTRRTESVPGQLSLSQCPNTSRARPEGGRYRLAVVADPDTDSKVGDGWQSFLLRGEIVIRGEKVEVTWGEEEVLTSNLGAGGRGMELSELQMFAGRLLTLDDRTGVVYSIEGNKVVPWVILSDGPGNVSKGFKAEWSTVVGDKLVVGGLGKEWTTTTGEIVNYHPMWVKMVSCDGAVSHHDWRSHYLTVREAVGISWPGYMIHEAVCWSEVRREWTFLPRRMSKHKYDDVTDERRGSNTIIIADENFANVRTLTVGEKLPTHGFSSCKFVPGTEDQLMVALKSEEIEGNVATYMMVFNMEGKVLYREQKIGDRKFEGVEFV